MEDIFHFYFMIFFNSFVYVKKESQVEKCSTLGSVVIRK